MMVYCKILYVLDRIEQVRQAQQDQGLQNK